MVAQDAGRAAGVGEVLGAQRGLAVEARDHLADVRIGVAADGGFERAGVAAVEDGHGLTRRAFQRLMRRR